MEQKKNRKKKKEKTKRIKLLRLISYHITNQVKVYFVLMRKFQQEKKRSYLIPLFSMSPFI